MKTVKGYPLYRGLNKIIMPEHSHILTAQCNETGEAVALFALVRTEKSDPPWHPETHDIYLCETDEEIPESIAGLPDERRLRYISTFQAHDVSHHVFEVLHAVLDV